ncbi:MAG: metal ABC transporter permease [Planctomycetia bacterium]|nr:metal ABC transporter permease [Planctomycetia bacterium]
MIREALDILAGWSAIDLWIVVTGALAAMACAVPGCFLLLRRQSMMGDALSHTSLLGVVLAFLAADKLADLGWLAPAAKGGVHHAIMVAGAMVVGLLAAILTEWIQKRGRVEASAALGVVFTIFFALGLLLVRVAADKAHIDPDCVLYGTVESAGIGDGVPEPALVNGIVLLVNLALVFLFFKELRISAFDPGLATALGVNARAMHYALMAVTAATLVAAYESVGVIVVVAMLIAPPATAHLLTDRLGRMILISLVVAAVGALLGHAMAVVLPRIVFARLGYTTVGSASSAGMMAVASGLLFGAAALFAPRHGVLSKSLAQWRLGLKIAAEDLLGLLYRLEEHGLSAHGAAAPDLLQRALPVGRLTAALASWTLRRNGSLLVTAGGYRLTDKGRMAARGLVRGHRLWESYLAKHFPLPPDHLHASAEMAEHYLGAQLRQELAGELAETAKVDPHGRSIPGEKDKA